MTQVQELDFTTDWTSVNFETWRRIIPPADVQTALEIGSWEGRSALFFLTHCPNCKITCIDTFEGSHEHAGIDALGSIETRFDSNLANYAKRIEKIKSRSIPALDRLGNEGREYDLIYIDGSHKRDDVVMDSFLAWRMLKAGGLMIWDDYRLIFGDSDRDSPQQAIELFLALHADELEIVHISNQVVIRRRDRNHVRKADFHWRLPRTPRTLLRFLLGRPLAVMSKLEQRHRLRKKLCASPRD